MRSFRDIRFGWEATILTGEWQGKLVGREEQPYRVYKVYNPTNILRAWGAMPVCKLMLQRLGLRFFAS